jgi:hypothetical protein
VALVTGSFSAGGGGAKPPVPGIEAVPVPSLAGAPLALPGAQPTLSFQDRTRGKLERALVIATRAGPNFNLDPTEEAVEVAAGAARRAAPPADWYPVATRMPDGP